MFVSCREQEPLHLLVLLFPARRFQDRPHPEGAGTSWTGDTSMVGWNRDSKDLFASCPSVLMEAAFIHLLLETPPAGIQLHLGGRCFSSHPGDAGGAWRVCGWLGGLGFRIRVWNIPLVLLM